MNAVSLGLTLITGGSRLYSFLSVIEPPAIEKRGRPHHRLLPIIEDYVMCGVASKTPFLSPLQTAVSTMKIWAVWRGGNR